MPSYAEWFTRFMGDPAIVEQSQKIQTVKREIGYDPNVTTVVKGPAMQDKTRVIRERTLQRMAERVYVDDMPELFAGLNEQIEANDVPDPDKLRCSFCNTVVDKINVTSEVKPKVRVKIEIVKDLITGKVSTVERVSTVPQRINACPRCCLNIQKPISAHRV